MNSTRASVTVARWPHKPEGFGSIPKLASNHPLAGRLKPAVLLPSAFARLYPARRGHRLAGFFFGWKGG